MADLSNMTVKYHFYNKPNRDLCCASWFVVVKDGNPKNLIPLVENDSVEIELMYQVSGKNMSLKEFMNFSISII